MAGIVVVTSVEAAAIVVVLTSVVAVIVAVAAFILADAAVLAALSERLFAAGVLPYYLHQMDRVQGAAHFEVPDDRALALVAALRARLPGYLVPRLVREVAGDDAKRPL